MATSLPTRCFISYSRKDSDFVDRLEADLRARGFETWVDRRRLEGAQHFEQEIYRAIDWSSLMLVILSPDAAASPAVALEYRYALGKNKVVIPVIWHYCQTPPELAKIQWIDFQAKGYDAGLKELLIAIADRADQRTSLPVDSRELYRQAIDARQRGDLERASILLQRLVDRESDYANGEAVRDLEAVNQSLYPERAQRLRQEAREARRKGEYSREAGALEALVALGGEEPWAQEYLPIAQQNRKQLELYVAVQEYMDKGDLAEARAKMTRLWADTPYFGDPAGIARKLDLAIPYSYDEFKEREEASGWKLQAEASAQTDLYRATAIEKQLWGQYKTNRSMAFPFVVCTIVLVFLLAAAILLISQSFYNSWNLSDLFSPPIACLFPWLLILAPLNVWLLRTFLRARYPIQPVAREKSQYNQWHNRREQEHTYKLQQLQQAYQQRVADIEAEYQQRLERITKKYAGTP